MKLLASVPSAHATPRKPRALGCVASCKSAWHPGRGVLQGAWHPAKCEPSRAWRPESTVASGNGRVASASACGGRHAPWRTPRCGGRHALLWTLRTLPDATLWMPRALADATRVVGRHAAFRTPCPGRHAALRTPRPGRHAVFPDATHSGRRHALDATHLAGRHGAFRTPRTVAALSFKVWGDLLCCAGLDCYCQPRRPLHAGAARGIVAHLGGCALRVWRLGRVAMCYAHSTTARTSRVSHAAWVLPRPVTLVTSSDPSSSNFPPPRAPPFAHTWAGQNRLRDSVCARRRRTRLRHALSRAPLLAPPHSVTLRAAPAAPPAARVPPARRAAPQQARTRCPARARATLERLSSAPQRLSSNPPARAARVRVRVLCTSMVLSVLSASATAVLSSRSRSRSSAAQSPCSWRGRRGFSAAQPRARGARRARTRAGAHAGWSRHIQ